jgi:hypothetical protein
MAGPASPHSSSGSEPWPALPADGWRETYGTLQRWTQIVGKVRAARSPWINHSWHVTLYVTARGLTTSPIPAGGKAFQIDFDFIDHRLHVLTTGGEVRSLALRPRSVADFYRELMAALGELGVGTVIDRRPNELEDAVPFDQDEAHTTYDPGAANRFWRALVCAERVFTAFRARFVGKCSPVHFFWGAFDLAVTRFSGRPAPRHPGGVPHLPDWVVREAYSHEVCSAGFWPGDRRYPSPAFYSYAYPEPARLSEASVRPAGASYHPTLREFLLPYDAVRTAASPGDALSEFLESTYRAAADLGRWDRSALERAGDPREGTGPSGG